ncbi:uncharacterized protein PGTG_20335 [Puccinia graminis f. sp. tritici CRL 75-36-700-3]|uniref:Helicase ATP-binding domain-containing protein n=1 Tax=Puccinia graminis f. sp. tritici (strain CRL 75-36-700-3 / race SCCL) TaxID=418459 RepID=E3NXT0_PUCGT|nr:uncharacterized protein PGTG_20335 [Puccinia graminis f. sp. tritici CRL 75-36-700-3]EFP94379.1 hypothetical protein PGTG_20335 [Puccinia graminis f. sp. tritici CRL 75-36-700-3]
MVQPTAIEEDNRHTIQGCKTKLMDHQMKAIKFIQRSESTLISTPLEIWNDPDNRWVHIVFEDAVQKGYLKRDVKFDAKGCILADDMGLGKTLTTLSAIQLSSEEALQFSRQEPNVPYLNPTSATLIICPLSTLENWKNEINIHFIRDSLPFKTFYGRDKCTIEFKDIAQVAVVLATYESVVTQIKSSQQEGSRNATEGRTMGLDFSSIKWFRIVLDEAHYLKDPRTNRSSVILGLEAERRLCLTGTPLQNQLGDLHSLIKFIRIEPWTENSIWKNCIESPVEMCDPRGISTLQTIMNRISMRRLKTTILSLPEKIETIINLALKTPWNETYERNHKAFSDQFGKNRTGGQGWNSSSFFADLVDLRQLCNHPALTEKGIGTKKYSWNESSKIVHLVQDLKLFLASGAQFRAVIFSEFKRFLEISINVVSELKLL